jgi:hypothetical protein
VILPGWSGRLCSFGSAKHAIKYSAAGKSLKRDTESKFRLRVEHRIGGFIPAPDFELAKTPE